VEDGDDDDSSSSDGSDMEVTVGADCLYGLSFSLRPRVLKTPCVGCDELYVVVDNLPRGVYTIKTRIKQLVCPSEDASMFVSVRSKGKVTLKREDEDH